MLWRTLWECNSRIYRRLSSIGSTVRNQDYFITFNIVKKTKKLFVLDWLYLTEVAQYYLDYYSMYIFKSIITLNRLYVGMNPMYHFATATFCPILRMLIYELNHIAIGEYQNSRYVKINFLFGKFRLGVLDPDTQSEQKTQFALIAPLLYRIGIAPHINLSGPRSQTSLSIPHYFLNVLVLCQFIYGYTCYTDRHAVLDQHGSTPTSWK